jgi:antitoxin component of RelBE/YafQ-DinJ toxin-antitoxin module
MGKPKYRPTNVVINPELKEEVKAYCKDIGIDFSQAVTLALKEWIADKY